MNLDLPPAHDFVKVICYLCLITGTFIKSNYVAGLNLKGIKSRGYLPKTLIHILLMGSKVLIRVMFCVL